MQHIADIDLYNISAKRAAINVYAVQQFHRVSCIQVKGEILAMVFIQRVTSMTVFAVHPEAAIKSSQVLVSVLVFIAAIQGWLL